MSNPSKLQKFLPCKHRRLATHGDGDYWINYWSSILQFLYYRKTWNILSVKGGDEEHRLSSKREEGNQQRSCNLPE